MKHAKVTTSTPQADGTILHQTKSYYEELASVKEQVEKHIPTTVNTFLSDVVSCLSVIKDQKTTELTISIKVDEFRKPRLITQIYTTKKENLREQ